MKLTSSHAKKLNGKKMKIAIVLPRFNDKIGMELYKNAVKTLQKHGTPKQNIHLTRVPGALELPLAVKLLARTQKYSAIIALGVVIRGGTYHFEMVCQQAHSGLMEVNLQTGIPVIFGILTADTEKQAQERAAETKLNKGREFAEAALEMAQLTLSLKSKKLPAKKANR